MDLHVESIARLILDMAHMRLPDRASSVLKRSLSTSLSTLCYLSYFAMRVIRLSDHSFRGIEISQPHYVWDSYIIIHQSIYSS